MKKVDLISKVSKLPVDTIGELSKKSNEGHDHNQYALDSNFQNHLNNHPQGFSGDYNDLSNKPSIPSVEGLASETYVNAELAKKSDSHDHPYRPNTWIPDNDHTHGNKSVIDAITNEKIVAWDNKSDAHSHPYKSDSYVPSWGDVTGKPSEFAPSGHNHSMGDITGLNASGIIYNGVTDERTVEEELNNYFYAIATLGEDRDIGENDKYTTVNGTKDFSVVKDNMYVDNIHIEGKTIVSVPLQDYAPTYNSSTKEICVLIPQNETVGKTFTLVNLSDKPIRVNMKPISSGMSNSSTAQPYSSMAFTVKDTMYLEKISGSESDGWVEPHEHIFKKSFILLRDDVSNIKISSYFEGMKSVGQGDKIDILTRKEDSNIWDGTYVTGGIYVTSGTDDNVSNLKKRTKYIDVIGGKTYYAKLTDYKDVSTAINIHLYDSNYNPVKWSSNIYNHYINNSNISRLDMPDNAKYIRFRTEDNRELNHNSVIISSKESIVGNEKHNQDKKQISTILRGLPSGVKDEIVKQGDRYVKVQNLFEYTLNGQDKSLSLTADEDTLGDVISVSYKVPNIKNTTSVNILCDKFNTNTGGYGTEGIKNYQDTVIIHIKRSKLLTVNSDGVSKWLQANPVTVAYELATPIITEIPNPNPRTFVNKTTFLLNTGIVQVDGSFEVTNSLGSALNTIGYKLSSLDNLYTELSGNRTALYNRLTSSISKL